MAQRDSEQKGELQTGANFAEAVRVGRLFALLVGLVLLSSCNLKSQRQQFISELKTLSSWAASLQMIGESWDAGTVPTRYATKALGNAADSLQTEAESLGKIQYTETTRSAALQRARNLLDAAVQIKQAVQQNDRSALGQQLERVKGEASALRQSLAEESAR